MFSRRIGNVLFLRLDPGEPLIACLQQLALKERIEFAAVTSGVGMLSELRLGFFDAEKNDYDVTKFVGQTFDLSNIVGNIALRDGNPVPHIHIVANRPDHSTLSGHVMEAHCHITMEIFVQILDASGIDRRIVPGIPATRLCG